MEAKTRLLFVYGLSMLAFVLSWSCTEKKQHNSSAEAKLADRICDCESALFDFNLRAAAEMSDAGEKRRSEIIEEGAKQMKIMESCVLNARAELFFMEKNLNRDSLLARLHSSCLDKPGSFHEKLIEELIPVLWPTGD